MPHEKEVLIKMKKQFLTVGITMSMTASLMGCAGNSADSAETQRPAAAKPESPSVDAAAPGAVTASEGNSDVNTAYNILFITTDQEHYFAEDPAGTNWKARALLAEMGTTFEKHYACSNMSTSSRSVMFTGMHIPQTGMIDNTDFAFQNAMDTSLTTVGDMMRDGGYYSALKGKWHLGDASILNNNAQLTDLEDYGYSDWGGKDYIGSLHEGHEVDSLVVSETAEWLDTVGSRLNSEGKPFFLQVNMVNPHDIMNYDNTGYKSPNMELGGKPDDPLYDNTYDVPIPSSWNFDLQAADVPDAMRIYQKHWGLYTGVIKDPGLWRDYQNYYFNCIQESDNNLMELLDHLKENKMMNHTVIVFTADHGEMHGSHAVKGKGGFLYENNIHVPLIIVHPDFGKGQRISSVTSHIDLVPTLVDLAGIPVEKKKELTAGLPGHSLLPLIDGSQVKVRDASLFCFEMLSVTAIDFGKNEEGNVTRTLNLDSRGMVRGITTDQYKFVRYFAPLCFNTPETLEELFENNDVQLFDLKADPEELDNLAADPETNRELILQMNALLNETIKQEIGEDDGIEVKKALRILKEMNQGS